MQHILIHSWELEIKGAVLGFSTSDQGVSYNYTTLGIVISDILCLKGSLAQEIISFKSITEMVSL